MQQNDRLVRYTSNRSAKENIWKESDFIYEDIENVQLTEPFFEPDVSIYAGGITWVDQEYDEKLGVAYFNPSSPHEFYVTGFDFEGDRFLLVEKDNKNEEFIFRPFLKSNLSIIPGEEKERFETESGMRESYANTSENSNDSHPLAVFHAMDNLSFEEVTIRFNRNLKLTIIVRNKEATTSLADMDLTKTNEISLNVQGEALREMATSTFDPTTSKNQKRVSRLSEILRRNLDTEDSPFKNYLPRFRVFLSKHQGMEELAPYNDNIKAPKDMEKIKTPEESFLAEEDTAEKWLRRNPPKH